MSFGCELVPAEVFRFVQDHTNTVIALAFDFGVLDFVIEVWHVQVMFNRLLLDDELERA